MTHLYVHPSTPARPSLELPQRDGGGETRPVIRLVLDAGRVRDPIGIERAAVVTAPRRESER